MVKLIKTSFFNLIHRLTPPKAGFKRSVMEMGEISVFINQE